MSQMHSQQHSQSQKVSLAELVTLDLVGHGGPRVIFLSPGKTKKLSCLQL